MAQQFSSVAELKHWVEAKLYNNVRPTAGGYVLADSMGRAVEVLCTGAAYIRVDIDRSTIKRIERESLEQEREDLRKRLDEINQELNQ